RSIKILCMFVVPCFVADTAYKIWWYTTGGSRIPHFGNVVVSHTIFCFLEQCSWLYRTSIFFLACVLYRVSCYLQILRLEDFAQVFQLETDVALVLMEHLRIRRTLRIISHRFRAFLLFTLLVVTASQFASLLVTTRSNSELCSVTLVTGVCICLRSAAKITHKAQAITSLAAKWHICATIDSFDAVDGEAPIIQSGSPLALPYRTQSESDDEEADVTYLENNRAGITVYGFMLDRSYLHTIFGVELSLVLWLLSKTVGIS
ncbi:Rho guanine nucleotide exchange factor 12, partial [Bienertia sinuspersici]